MSAVDYLLAGFAFVGFLSSVIFVAGLAWLIRDDMRHARRRRVEREIIESPVLSEAIRDSVRLRVCEGPAHVYRLSDWRRGDCA